MFFPEEAKLSWTRLVVTPNAEQTRLVVRGSLMNSSVAVARVEVIELEDGVWIRVYTKFAWPGSEGEFMRELPIARSQRRLYFGKDKAVVWER